MRPSVAALQSSKRVQKLVSVWQGDENNAVSSEENLPIPSVMINKHKNLQVQDSPKRTPLSPLTNSPQHSPNSTPTTARKRKRNENILDYMETRVASPSKTKLRRQTFAGSPSTSPLKRQKISENKEKAILSPLRKTKSRRPTGTPIREKATVKNTGLTTPKNTKPLHKTMKSPDLVKSPKALVDEQKEKDRLQKLREALKEIYTTEQTYWKNLLQMQSVFYFESQSVLSPKQLKIIFGNSASILLHSQSLLLSLREVEDVLEENESENDHETLRQAAEEIVERMTDYLVCNFSLN